MSKVWQLISDAFLDYLVEHPEAFEEGLPQKFTPPPERVVCATCGLVLGRHTVDDVLVGFMHQGEDTGKVYDHAANPVPESQAEVINDRCDFCNADNSTAWLYFTKETRGASVAVANYSGKITETPLGQRGKQDWVKTQADVTGFTEVSTRHASADHLWSSCNECAKLIELRDIERLVTRYRRMHPEMQSVTRSLIKAYWQGVFWGYIWFRIPAPEGIRGSAA